MKNKITAVLLVLSLMFLLSSCRGIQTVELNERLIIEAIGIDEHDGIYSVTTEGLDTLTAGNDNSSISGEKLTKCYKFEGETIGSAINSISVVTGQIPLFSQARILVIGQETAKNHLSEVLDFFRREYTTRTDIPIAVAEKKASEIVAANFGKNVSAGNILEAAVSSYKHTGTSVYTPLFKFLKSVKNKTESPVCPILNIKKNSFDDTSEVEIKGTAVFGKDGAIEILTPTQTQAMLIINGKLKNGDFTVSTQKGTFTLEIISCKSKIKTQIENGKVRFSIKSELKCDIPEFQSEGFLGLNKSDTETLSAQAAKEIGIMLTDILKDVLYDKNYDIFGIGRRIELKDFELYESMVNNKPSYKDFVGFDIDVTVSIRRIGKVVLEKE